MILLILPAIKRKRIPIVAVLVVLVIARFSTTVDATTIVDGRHLVDKSAKNAKEEALFLDRRVWEESLAKARHFSRQDQGRQHPLNQHRQQGRIRRRAQLHDKEAKETTMDHKYAGSRLRNWIIAAACVLGVLVSLFNVFGWFSLCCCCKRNTNDRNPNDDDEMVQSKTKESTSVVDVGATLSRAGLEDEQSTAHSGASAAEEGNDIPMPFTNNNNNNREVSFAQSSKSNPSLRILPVER